MQGEAKVSTTQTEADDSLDKYRRLLANLYVHNCALPELDELVKYLIDNWPRWHYRGTMTLVHVFVMLVNESVKMKNTAEISENFESNSMKQLFGPGDEFQKGQCPMKMFITYVMQRNELLTHEAVVHLIDYLHAVIFFNDVHATRVEAVCARLLELDDFYFALSSTARGRILIFLHTACLECVREDSFIACVYECFATMERNKMLCRGNTDKDNQKKIYVELGKLLLKCKKMENDADDTDDEDEDDDAHGDEDVAGDDDVFEPVSSSVTSDVKSELCANDDDSEPCANHAEPCNKNAE